MTPSLEEFITCHKNAEMKENGGGIFKSKVKIKKAAKKGTKGMSQAISKKDCIMKPCERSKWESP